MVLLHTSFWQSVAQHLSLDNVRIEEHEMITSTSAIKKQTSDFCSISLNPKSKKSMAV